MKATRILHLVWSGEIGGTENFAFDLAREQTRRHEVALAWMSRCAGRPARAGDLQLRDFGMKSGYDALAFIRGVKWARAFAPDVVHLHEATPLAYWVGWACSAPVTLAHIHTIGNPFSRESVFRRAFLKRSAGRVTHYIANSRSTRDLLTSLRGVDAARITTLPNAIDLSRFDGPRDPAAARRELGLPENAPIVGFVGRLHPAKGADSFLRVAAAVGRDKPEVFFVVVGDGQDRAALEQQVRELGLGSRVLFAGERPDVPRWLAAFTVFVSTSRVETFGIAILEAMAAGLPVVAFAAGAIPELLTGCGRLAPAGDEDACAAAVTALLDDPAERRRLADAAYNRARNEYSIGQVSLRVEELYRRFLEAQKAAGSRRDPE